MGCDRFLFIGLSGLSILLVFMGGIMSGNLQNCIIGAALFWFGMLILVQMAKLDPHMSQVYMRSMFYKPEYFACSTAFYTPKKTHHRKKWLSK